MFIDYSRLRKSMAKAEENMYKIFQKRHNSELKARIAELEAELERVKTYLDHQIAVFLNMATSESTTDEEVQEFLRTHRFEREGGNENG